MSDADEQFDALKSTRRAEIVSNPNIRGGEPCFKGTRLPVAVILACLAGGDDAEEIYDSYPSLPLGGIEAAIAWERQQRDAA